MDVRKGTIRLTVSMDIRSSESAPSSSSIGETRHSTFTSDAFPNLRAAGTTSSDALVIFNASTCRAASTAIIFPASMHCRTSAYRIKLSTAARHGAGRCAGESSSGAGVRGGTSSVASASRASALRLRDTTGDGIENIIMIEMVNLQTKRCSHAQAQEHAVCAGGWHRGIVLRIVPRLPASGRIGFQQKGLCGFL